MKIKKLEAASLFIFLAALAFLYVEPVVSMVGEWYTDENYSHGFLIPIISGYLAWQRKDELTGARISPANSGLIIVALGLLMYLLGNVAGENFTMRLSLLVVVAGALIFAYGYSFFGAMLFPYMYLFFMLPLPFILYDAVAFPLKLMVTEYSVLALKFIGIPVLREGNIIELVNVTLEVADACSGIRSIVSLLALSTAFAFFTQKGFYKRLILIALAIPIAIVANSIRVIGTGILASRFGSAVAEGFFHEFAGLVIFGIAIAMLVVSAFVLRKIGKN
jgi:exosortase